MNRFDGFSRWALSILLVCTLGFALGGCEGSDGAAGAAGATGSPGSTGPAGPPGVGIDAIAAAQPESCATCHSGVGDDHQSEYNKYTDASNLSLTIQSVTSAADGSGGFDGTMTIHVERDGMPVSGVSSWSSRGRTVWGPAGMSQMSFYTVAYNDATQTFNNSRSFSFDAATADQGEGDYVLTSNSTFNPVPANGQAYGYVVADPLDTEGLTLYDNVANASLAYGNVGNYQSAANVEGCETCHGAPYMKHGYREAAVVGLPGFAACKSCHYDTRGGNHEDWQYMVDDPLGWATDVAATGDYTYTANVMNDTHMSHAMEFPYPQSMANCATCHEGKLTQTLANTNFTLATCKSCHALQGLDARPELVEQLVDGTIVVVEEEGQYYQSHRAPSLEFLWDQAGVEGIHDPVTGANCQACHIPLADGGVARVFDEIHSGYDERISDPDTGARWADTFTASIDDINLTGNLLAVTFSVSDPAMVPYLSVSFYGWDSKHFVIASHDRDVSLGCSGGTRGCRMEMKPGDAADNALFTESGAGPWTVTLDMAAYVSANTLNIPDLIINGAIKNAEITIAPRLYVDADTTDELRLGLDAVTQTFDVVAGGFVSDYFKDGNATVDIEKCNVCHDQLAVTFHAGSGRGGDIVACKNCHVTTNGGSHLEMQSRSIDSYVHAVHSFQAFDLDDVDAADDPVFDARTALHVNHTFPNFTIANCEGCHVSGTYNVPDQAKSMPGLLSSSFIIPDRAIGYVPEAVTGPASRACGGCHRADLINADLAGDLASFDAHTANGGTYVENDAEDVVLWGVIDKIMSLFQ